MPGILSDSKTSLAWYSIFKPFKIKGNTEMKYLWIHFMFFRDWSIYKQRPIWYVNNSLTIIV